MREREKQRVERKNMKYLMNVVCLLVIISLQLVNGWKKKPFNFGGMNQQQQQGQRPMTGLMNPFRPQRPVPMMMSECCACTPCCACPGDGQGSYSSGSSGGGGQGSHSNGGSGGGDYGSNNNNNNNNNKYSEQAQSGSSDEIQIWVDHGTQGNPGRPPFNFYNNWRPMKAQMVNINPTQNTGQMSQMSNQPYRRQLDDVIIGPTTGSDSESSDDQ